MKNNPFLYLLLISACLFLNSNVQAQQFEKLNNQNIISMTKAELSEDIIIKKIRSSQTDFDLTTDSLIEFKQAGVSDEVVKAMLEASIGISGNADKKIGNPNTAVANPNYGIYLYEESGDKRNLIQLMPNISVQNRVGGKITAALVPLGFGKVKTKANLAGKNADLQISYSRPVFHFQLDAQSGGLNTQSGIPTSPKEIYLVKFNIRNNEREIAITKENSYGVKGGLSDEYVIEFEYEDLGNGKFRVYPKEPLEKGEYAFYLADSGNSNVSSGIGLKFFDFGVRN